MGEELGVRLLMAFIMIAVGILLVATARAAATGRLGRNAIAGIRTASTMASDEAWRAAHQRAERPTVAAGVAAGVTGLVALVAPVPGPWLSAVALIGCGVMLGFVARGAVVGGRAAREVSGS